MTGLGEPGEHVEPLTDKELKTLLNAVDNLVPGYRRVANIAPFTGLLKKEYTHLRESWIEWSDDVVAIHIPESMPCTSVKYTSSSWDIAERDGPCIRSKVDDAPPGRVYSKKERTIYVTETRAQAALRGVFSMADENPASTVHIHHIIDKLPLDFTYRQLRFTRLRLLGDRGIDPNQIAAEWGVTPKDSIAQFPSVMRNILRDSAHDYYDPYNRAKEILALLNKQGAMTAGEISNALAQSGSSVWRRIDTLEKYNAVETSDSMGLLIRPVLTVKQLDSNHPKAGDSARNTLAVLNEEGPTHKPELEGELGVSTSEVHRRVESLKEYDTITVSDFRGRSITPLKTVNEFLQCPSCGKQYNSIRAKNAHEQQVHEDAMPTSFEPFVDD